MKKVLVAAAIGISATVVATVALADPNIDMSDARLNNGLLDFNINSYSAAGAQIQGTRTGIISAEVGAYNLAWGEGEVGYTASLETDNAGAGVHTFGGIEAEGYFITGVEGEAFAATDGRGSSNTVAATFGEAGIGFDGTFNIDLGLTTGTNLT